MKGKCHVALVAATCGVFYLDGGQQVAQQVILQNEGVRVGELVHDAHPARIPHFTRIWTKAYF